MLTAIMAELKAFISSPDHQARFLSHDRLIRQQPTRVISAQEISGSDLELWVSGQNRLGMYYGRLTWSEIQRRPRLAAWLARTDIETVANMARQIRRRNI